MNSQQLKDAAMKIGVDLIGIAPIDRFRNQPPETNPASINPDVRSVIVLGFRIPRGALCGVETGTAWQTLWAGSPVHPLIIGEMTYLVVRALESEGWEATPVFQHPKEMQGQGVRVQADKPEADVIMDMDYAAHASGLGEIGMGKFFLTPEFGPRQVFSAILTDATLEVDEVFKGTLCDECGLCLKACPAQALSGDKTTTTELCEGSASWHTLRVESCLVCKTGTIENPYCSNAEPWRVGAACGRACIAHLEDGGKLSRKFQNRFQYDSTGA